MLVPLAPSFGVLLALRGVSGLALGALPALAMAHLVAQARPGRASAIGGLYIAGTTIGGLTGRVLTGAVGGVAGWRWGLATTATLVVHCRHRVRHPAAARSPRRRPATRARHPQPGRIRLALADRTVWVFYAQAFLLMGGFVTVYNLLAFRLLDDPYRLPASVVSLLFLTYLVGTVGSSGVGRMVGRFGRKAVLAAAGYGMAVGVALTLARHCGACWPDWWSRPSASSSPTRSPRPGPVSGCRPPDRRHPRSTRCRTTQDPAWSASWARWCSTGSAGPGR